jgi:hypothetical protein
MKMNFGRLLAAGKSLMNGHVAGRYQMRENFRLPQFISPKNPFAVEAAAAESGSPPMSSEQRPVVSAVTMAGKVSGLLAQTGETSKRAALWCLDRNPFSAIGRPRLPKLPRFGKPAVQGELSLEKIQVVRGDLAHADLEVVEAGGAPSAAWRNLTTRVFGSETRVN